MSRIRYDANLIRLISFFESFTRSKVRDCFESNGGVVFVVEEGGMAKAVGRGGSTVRRIEAALKRKVKLVEYSPDPTAFLSRLIAPLKAKGIKRENSVLTVQPNSARDRSAIIGRGGSMLRNYERVLQRYFADVKEVRVA